jgi:uncharacterized protein HemX
MSLFNGPIAGLPLFYLDPGSGSFLVQLLLAAALGLGVGVKLYWSKIKSLFGKKKTDSAQAAEENDEE